MFAGHVPAYPFGFRRGAECVCVGIGFDATGVVCGDFAFRLPLAYGVGGVFVSDGDTVVIDLVEQFRVVVARKRDFEVGDGFLDDFYRLLRQVHRTLVHGNPGDVEPAFFFQV